MYCNGSSGMATLLQQKNYKTLSNNGGNAANNVVIDGTSSMANGHSSLDGMAASSKGKMLLPHELVTVPTTTNVSANYTSNPFNGYQQQQQPQHNSLHQHPHQMNQRLTTTSIHHNTTTNNHLANHSYTAATTTASSTSSAIHHQFYQSGSLSQLSSEQQQQLLDDCIEEDDGGDGEDETQNSGPAADSKHEQSTGAGEQQDVEPEPEIDIVINNVVCSFSVRCHLNLRQIALNGFNVEFRRENGMVTMKLRRPYTTASIWSSGRITCTGATSEEQVRGGDICGFNFFLKLLTFCRLKWLPGVTHVAFRN
jgi:Transcription factor TFIID (or TATA-binding protein, TBP)